MKSETNLSESAMVRVGEGEKKERPRFVTHGVVDMHVFFSVCVACFACER